MRVSSYGYNAMQYDPDQFRETVRAVASVLPRIMRELDADTVVVTGKSGVSVAFAASMLIDFPLVVVRKPTENSHGRAIEGPSGHEVRNYIILDDFVETGATVERTVDAMRTACCVGVVQYTASNCGLHERISFELEDRLGLGAPKAYGLNVEMY